MYVCQGGSNPLLMSSGLIMEPMKWINAGLEPESLDCEVQVRHRGKPVECNAVFKKDEVEIKFKEEIRAIAPGQSAVLYSNNQCLGGGIIAKSIQV